MNTQPNTPASRNEEAVQVGQILALERRCDMTNDEALRFARAVLTLAAPGAAIDAGEQEGDPNDKLRRLQSEHEQAIWDRGYEAAVNELSRANQKVCIVDAYSSRMCERGTKGCNTKHAAPSEALSPAPVAQPVDRAVIGYTWTQANGKHRSVGAAPHPTNAHNIEPIYYPFTQPCASQGCATDKSGGAE